MSNVLDFLEEEVAVAEPLVMAVPDFLADAPEIDVVFDDNPGEEAFVEAEDGRLIPASLAERVAQCGLLRHKPDWRTGKRTGYYQKCDLHLYCQACLERRAEKEAERMLDVLGGGQVRVLTIPAGEDTAKIVRDIDSACYRRYPQEDGSTVIIHTDEDVGGEEVDAADLDWLALARTPEGANWSGKLSTAAAPIAEKEEEQEEGISKGVRVPEFTVEDPLDRMKTEQQEDYNTCWEFATLATAHLDPDLDTVAWAMRERMRHYRSALEGKSYRVRFFVYEFERAVDAEIDWKPYNALIRKKLQVQGYTNVALDPPGVNGKARGPDD